MGKLKRKLSDFPIIPFLLTLQNFNFSLFSQKHFYFSQFFLLFSVSKVLNFNEGPQTQGLKMMPVA